MCDLSLSRFAQRPVSGSCTLTNPVPQPSPPPHGITQLQEQRGWARPPHQAAAPTQREGEDAQGSEQDCGVSPGDEPGAAPQPAAPLLRSKLLRGCLLNFVLLSIVLSTIIA